MSLIVDGQTIERVFVNGDEVYKVFANNEKVFAYEIEYIGSASTRYTGYGSASINVSSLDIRSGDIMICVLGNGNHTSRPVPNVPSGFSNLFSRSGGSSNRNALMRLSYRICNGSETSVSFTANHQGGGAVVQVFRNVDTSSPFDVGLTSLSGNTYNNNVNPRPITPITEGAVIVASGVAFTQFTTNPSLSSSDLSGFTYNGTAPSTYGSVSGMGYRRWNGSGTYDPTSWGFSGNTGGANYMTATIALRPKY
jgi:hypothetical protein